MEYYDVKLCLWLFSFMIHDAYSGQLINPISYLVAYNIAASKSKSLLQWLLSPIPSRGGSEVANRACRGG